MNLTGYLNKYNRSRSLVAHVSFIDTFSSAHLLVRAVVGDNVSSREKAVVIQWGFWPGSYHSDLINTFLATVNKFLSEANLHANDRPDLLRTL